MQTIDDKLLRELGGWQAMQEARRMVAAGLVRDVVRVGDRFRGRVEGAGRGVGAVTLEVMSTTEATVACGCPAGRRGLVCGHGLALALAWLAEHATRVKSAANDEPGAETSIAANHVKDCVTRSAAITCDASVWYSPRCPNSLRDCWEKSTLPIVLERVSDFQDSPSASLLNAGALVEWLGGGAVPPALRLDGDLAARFLALLGRAGVDLATADGPVAVSGEPWRPQVRVRWADGMARLDWADPPVAHGPGGWVRAGDGLYPPPDWAALGGEGAGVLAGAWRQGTPVVRPDLWLVRHLGALEEICRVEGAEGLEIDDRPPTILLSLDGSLQKLTAELAADYGVARICLPAAGADSARFPAAVPGHPHGWRVRNHDAEQEAVRKLEGMGFAADPSAPWAFQLGGEGNVLTFFASYGRIVPDGWRTEWGDRFRAASRHVEKARFEWCPHPRAGPGWLEGEVVCRTTGDIRVSRVEIQRLLRSGRSHFQTEQGRKVVVDTAMAADLDELWSDIGAVQSAPGVFRFDARQAAYLRLTLGGTEAAPVLPDIVEATAGPSAARLRPYQRHGVAWLAAQATNGLGALLADDMGLGKTLQTQVFLEWQRRQGGTGPALVVCPTSVIPTWVDEAAKFHPRWRVLVQHGAARADYWDLLDAADLVVTSYALVGRDALYYRDREFRAIVLDEASLVRNPDTQAAKGVRSLQGKVRIALTGTPIENSVRDLWSLFEFLQPGYLGHRKEFRLRYELPMAGGAEPAVAARLHRRTRPFVLRRRKDEVAADLPPRIEKVEWCELVGAQADLYNAILRESRDKVTQDIRSRGFDGARMSVLTALLRLRQVCCDPALLPGGAARALAGGAKRERFRELLREAREGGHRVLVFSQFVSMLELLRAEAAADGVPHAWLTGASVDRADQVRRFQGGGCDVFFLSLKAGGYGLTLTAADTVILYDPWWNPAVESQAIDRAHRIGQARAVNAYRLVTRGTVEEKILLLQKKKRGASSSVLGDDAAALAPLGEDDLRELLGI